MLMLQNRFLKVSCSTPVKVWCMVLGIQMLIPRNRFFSKVWCIKLLHVNCQMQSNWLNKMQHVVSLCFIHRRPGQSLMNEIYFHDAVYVRFTLLYFKCRFRALLGPCGGSFGITLSMFLLFIRFRTVFGYRNTRRCFCWTANKYAYASRYSHFLFWAHG